MMSRSIVVVLVAMGISTSCSPTGPSLRSDTQSPSPTGPGARDTSAVTAGIVDQFRSLGLDARIAERFGGFPFSVEMQRVAVTSYGGSIYLHVYRTAELAADEASRITWDGQVRPPEGSAPPRMIVDYIAPQAFYHRDRVIARHSGCDATVTNAIERLFGPPVVVTGPCPGAG